MNAAIPEVTWHQHQADWRWVIADGQLSGTSVRIADVRGLSCTLFSEPVDEHWPAARAGSGRSYANGSENGRFLHTAVISRFSKGIVN
ncbi:hypothetical protein [Sphingomonas faeni]|uniref:hypothetical protein n=1 Tax=Sphingomonas faeni TaxID=185950 RepID=UPI003363984C